MSLLVSFAANDGEEWLTMSRTLPASMARAPRWLPGFVRERQVSQAHVNVGVVLMGLLYTAAAVDGVRSRGAGRLYQDVQLVFGLHGFTHLAASAATRGYTSGVLTSPTVVIPQWRWAAHELAAAGVPRVGRLSRALPVVLGWLAASHLAAQAVTGG